MPTYAQPSALKPHVLFRPGEDTFDELDVATQHFLTSRYRTDVPAESLVVGRYSVLPFYAELEHELALRGSRLVNNYAQHQWLADVSAWAPVLGERTPRTWTTWHSLPEGAYVVKGKTNSRKNKWDTHMFAPTREAIPGVVRHLLDDALISEQGLVVREYVPLVRLGEGLNGIPVSQEWRTFWYQGKLLASGFYWQGSHPELAPDPEHPRMFEMFEHAFEAAQLVKEYANAYVIDMGLRVEGGWTVIELNDLQMSGLCGCSADQMYRNLADVMGRK